MPFPPPCDFPWRGAPADTGSGVHKMIGAHPGLDRLSATPGPHLVQTGNIVGQPMSSSLSPSIWNFPRYLVGHARPFRCILAVFRGRGGIDGPGKTQGALKQASER